MTAVREMRSMYWDGGCNLQAAGRCPQECKFSLACPAWGHHIRPTLLQWGLEPSVRQDVCSLVCHTPQQYLSSSTQPTYVTSLVPVGTGACDCWICRGRIRLRGMKYKSAQGQLQMQCCMVESSWNHRSQGTWVVSPVYINTCVNSGLYGGLFPHL